MKSSIVFRVSSGSETVRNSSTSLSHALTASGRVWKGPTSMCSRVVKYQAPLAIRNRSLLRKCLPPGGSPFLRRGITGSAVRVPMVATMHRRARGAASVADVVHVGHPGFDGKCDRGSTSRCRASTGAPRQGQCGASNERQRIGISAVLMSVPSDADADIGSTTHAALSDKRVHCARSTMRIER